MTHIDIMQDDSEIVHYERAGIPLYVKIGKLSNYPNMRALCHWHDDIEFIYILKGKMNYYINGKNIILNKNDCIMINTRQMHYGYSFENQDCDFYCILFHPYLFTSNKVIYQNYVLPILENQNLEYIYFDSKENFTFKVSTFLDKLIFIKNSASFAYEMEIVGIMHVFWSKLLQHIEIAPKDITENIKTDLKIQKDMVSYIYQHYSEKLSLEKIAASGHVCRNKCCLIFKHYLQQSPIDFLNAYRLKVSCNLLINTSESITRIAFASGFNNLSYYSKIFFKNYKCSPSEYRKLNLQSYRN